MLEALRRYFDSKLANAGLEQDPAGMEHALQLATAALLVEMQRADASVDEVETDAIRATLARHFRLATGDIEELLRLAGERADASVSLHEFTRIIHAHFTPEQKVAVVEMLWRIAYADGRVDPHEEHLVRKVADLLYVSQVAYVRARERAAGGGSGKN